MKTKNRTSKEGRVCNKCLKFQAWSMFYTQKTGFNGYRSMCKDCMNSSRAENHAKNRDRANEKHRIRWHNDPLRLKKNVLDQKYYRDKTNKRNRQIIGKRSKQGEAKQSKIEWLVSRGYDREYLNLLYK